MTEKISFDGWISDTESLAAAESLAWAEFDRLSAKHGLLLDNLVVEYLEDWELIGSKWTTIPDGFRVFRATAKVWAIKVTDFSTTSGSFFD